MFNNESKINTLVSFCNLYNVFANLSKEKKHLLTV